MLSTHRISASSADACINILSVSFCCPASFEDSDTFPGSGAGVREGVRGINDLIHWSEGDPSTCFLPFLCDVKAAFPILTTLTSLEQ